MSILALALIGYGVMCVLAAVFVISAAMSNRIRHVRPRSNRDSIDNSSAGVVAGKPGREVTV